jgi:hypothetical protein
VKKYARWGWLFLVVVSILTTPSAVVDAIHLGRSDHRLMFVIPLAFIIRFAVTWWFFKLWWGSRPSAQRENSK